MSKSKAARFRLSADETVLKQGMADYCMTGGYAHAVPGDATLTDRRFYFYARLSTGDVCTVEIPLGEVYAVEKTGIPFLTRSMRIVAKRGSYRFNAFFVGRWVVPLRAAVAAWKAKAVGPLRGEAE